MGITIEYKQDKKHNWIKIECPLRFSTPELGTDCIKENCAWWMPIQKACAINVNARCYGYIKNQG